MKYFSNYTNAIPENLWNMKLWTNTDLLSWLYSWNRSLLLGDLF